MGAPAGVVGPNTLLAVQRHVYREALFFTERQGADVMLAAIYLPWGRCCTNPGGSLHFRGSVIEWGPIIINPPLHRQ